MVNLRLVNRHRSPISVVSFPFLHHERSNIGKPNIPICSMYGISPTFGPFIMKHLDLSWERKKVNWDVLGENSHGLSGSVNDSLDKLMMSGRWSLSHPEKCSKSDRTTGPQKWKTWNPKFRGFERSWETLDYLCELFDSCETLGRNAGPQPLFSHHVKCVLPPQNGELTRNIHKISPTPRWPLGCYHFHMSRFCGSMWNPSGLQQHRLTWA